MASRNRGKSKVTIRDLSRLWPTDDERRAVTSLVARPDNHPVVTAILGSSFLEYDLEQMVRKRFNKKDDDTWNKLTDENGPLSGFFSKITIAQAFGLIDDTLAEALHTVRRVRNAFAHAKKLIDFDNPLVLAEFRKIRLPPSKKTNFSKGLQLSRTAESGYAAYVILCFTISNELLRKQVRALKRSRRKAIMRSPLYAAAMAAALGRPPGASQAEGPLSLLGRQSGGPNAPIAAPDQPQSQNQRPKPSGNEDN